MVGPQGVDQDDDHVARPLAPARRRRTARRQDRCRAGRSPPLPARSGGGVRLRRRATFSRRRWSRKLALDQASRIARQALRLRLALRRLGDDHVRQVRGVVIGLVALDPLEDRQLALAVAAPAHRLEAARGERLAQHLAVPEELVPPAVEGAVDPRAPRPLGRGLESRPVVGRPRPSRGWGSTGGASRRARAPGGPRAGTRSRRRPRRCSRKCSAKIASTSRNCEPLGHVGHHVHPGQVAGCRR